MALTALDILVAVLIGAGLVLGFLRGFVAETLSLIAWILAILALSYFHAPVSELLRGPVGTGAWLLAFLLIFGVVFVLGKLASRRLGGRVRRSVVGPIDRVLGALFGGLKGLIVATLVFLALNFVFDMMWGRAAPRPLWMSESRSWPLLETSGAAVSDLVETRRGSAAEQAPADANQSAANAQ